MIYQEIHWIRSNLDKLSPSLRKLALEWYRPFRHIPCFLQKYFKGVRKKSGDIASSSNMNQTWIKTIAWRPQQKGQNAGWKKNYL